MGSGKAMGLVPIRETCHKDERVKGLRMRRNILLRVLIATAGLVGTAGAGEEPPAGPPSYYTFQVMTLPAQYRDNAERLLKELQAKGYPAYLLEVGDVPGTELYKIRVGRFSKAVDARAAAERFSEQEGKKVLVVRSQALTGLPAEAPMPPAPEKAPAVAEMPAAPGGQKETPAQPAASASPPAESSAPPEKRPETAGPAAAPKEMPAAAGRAETPGPRDLAWPDSVSRIFWYRAADNTLHVTNVPLPSPDPARLERVSVFPVRYESAGDAPGTLVLEVDGERMEIILAGVRISAPRDRESAFYERRLREVPLRLDFETEPKTGARAGRLSWRDGAPLNLELVRLGIAVCASEGVDPEEQAACRAAEEEAGRLKKN